MGDLIVTCSSLHSRNRRAGILIGQGKNARGSHKVGGNGGGLLRIPHRLGAFPQAGGGNAITAQCYRICYENQSPKVAIGASLWPVPVGTKSKLRGWEKSNRLGEYAC